MTDRGSPLASTYIARLPSRFISSTIERRPRIAPFTVVLQKTDLILPGRLPLALTCVYRTLDDSPGPFGPWTSHAYEVFLRALSSDALLLTLPDNSRATFARRVDMSEKSPKQSD